MLWKTHLMGGIATGFFVATKTGMQDLKITTVSVMVAGMSALIADIEDPKSWLGRHIPLIPWFLKWTVGHRKSFHSILGGILPFSILCWCILKATNPHFQSLLVYAVAGYLSHLLLDTFNPEGVPWLWPLRTRLCIPIVESCSLLERVVVLPVMFLFSCLTAIIWKIT